MTSPAIDLGLKSSAVGGVATTNEIVADIIVHVSLQNPIFGIESWLSWAEGMQIIACVYLLTSMWSKLVAITTKAYRLIFT